jgi:hypothetical protein
MIDPNLNFPVVFTDFPVLRVSFPVQAAIFPVLFSREIHCQAAVSKVFLSAQAA